MFIESAHNKIAKQTVSLQNKKNRDEQQMFVVEGFKQVSEIPKDWEIEYIICILAGDFMKPDVEF